MATGPVGFPGSEAARSIPECFAWAAAAHPSRLALKAGGESLTFDALDRKANRIAHALLERCGEGPEPIAAALTRRTDVIAAMLGILKAGKAYVPLDPTQPPARHAYILKDTEARLVVTDAANRERTLAAGGEGLEALDLDRLDRALPETDPGIVVAPDALSHILYTSGSTGEPKGVMQTHRNFIHAAWLYTRDMKITAEDRIGCLSSLSFIGGIRPALAALFSGAAFFPLMLADLGTLPEILARERISVYHSPSSVFRHFLGTLDGAEDLPHLRRFYGGGEALYAADIQRWRRVLPGRTYLHVLALTEADVIRQFLIDSTTAIPGEVVPMGHPVADAEVLLLRDDGGKAAPGETGEIVTRSRYLSPGYWRKPELTAAVFGPDPAGGGIRRYRTGDLGRIRPDGCLEFAGRRDFQVKVRGGIVQIGEVEGALREVDGVREAVVRAQADRYGQTQLVAWCGVGSARGVTVTCLRARLRERLAETMIPSAFVLMDELPLTPSGKVNRAALPEPGTSRPALDVPFVPPRGDVEEAVARTWSGLLNVSPVGADDDFFDLGGDSLLAARAVSAICEQFDVELPMQLIFETPTVAGLAERVASARKPQSAERPGAIVRVPRDGPLPVAFSQHGFWMLDQFRPGLPAYNVPFAVRLSGPLDAKVLERALNEIIRRHEVLRTTFHGAKTGPVQKIHPEMPIELERVDLRGSADAEGDLRGLLVERARRRFNLAAGPLVRASLFRLGDDCRVLLVTMHHIVSDRWSLSVLCREIGAIYAALIEGRPCPLDELAVQFGDWASWDRRRFSDRVEEPLAYWREKLSGARPVLALPMDRERPSFRTFAGERRYADVSAETVDALRALARTRRATLFMTVLAALQALIFRHTGCADQVFGSPSAGRDRPEARDLIGCFMNTVVYRNDLSGDPAFGELLARVRGTCLAARDHELPFAMLLDALAPPVATRYLPVVQAMLLFQNTPDEVIDIPGVAAEAVELDPGVARLDLTLIVNRNGSGLRLAWEYSTDVFDAETIERLAEEFGGMLERAARRPDLRLSEP